MEREFIVASDVDVIYKKILTNIYYYGNVSVPRGMKILELPFQHIILSDPRARLIQNKARKLSLPFCLAEFIWIMSGDNTLEFIGEYNRKYRDFSDDGSTLHGAYGPRIRNWVGGKDQLVECLKKLQQDKDTRQAVMIIYNPTLDTGVVTKDVPCNNLLQFLLRDHKLHLGVYVRSNDMILGFPYDIFHWTLLQELFASILGVELGEYHHIIGSAHIYEKDNELAKSILLEPVTHHPMESMPKTNSLSTLDSLVLAERVLRKQRKLPQDIILQRYWFEWLIILGRKLGIKEFSEFRFDQMLQEAFIGSK